jgi:hypothetical protein
MNLEHLTKRQLKKLSRSYGRSLSKLQREYVYCIGKGFIHLAQSHLESSETVVASLCEIQKELERRG